MSVVTAADVENARDVLVLAANDVITPLARDRAKELGVRLERGKSGAASSDGLASSNSLASSNGPTSSKGAASTGGAASTKGTASRNGSASTAGAASRNRRQAEGAGTTGGIAIADLPSAGARRAGEPAVVRPDPRSGALYRRGAPAADAALTRPSVAVIGAGHVGAATGIRLAERDVFERLTLIDVVDGLAAGLALDMWHSAALLGFTTRVTGSADLQAVAGADIVVITAGRPRKPGMTRTDLTAANAQIVREIAAAVRECAPGAIVIVVTNPLEEMTHLAAEVTGFPPQRVFGMGGVLDTARFRALVGLTGVARPEDVRAIVLGSHGAEMVVPLSQASANGTPLEDLLDAQTLADIVARTRESGAEVTRLLRVGSAYVSPGSAIARQVEAVVRGTDDVVPACVASGGAYGIRDVRVGLPVLLGPQGVREIVELALRPAELRALRDAAEAIRVRTQALH